MTSADYSAMAVSPEDFTFHYSWAYAKRGLPHSYCRKRESDPDAFLAFAQRIKSEEDSTLKYLPA